MKSLSYPTLPRIPNLPKCLAAVATLLLATPVVHAQQATGTINFDTAGNWVQDGSIAFVSYGSHGYTEGGWTFTSALTIRNTTAVQDTVAGALGTYAWRLRDATGSQLLATFDGAMTVTDFGFDVRRWDGSPDTNYTVEYSTDSGTSYLPTGITINNTFLASSSAWKTLTYSLPSPVAVTAGQFKVRVARVTGTFERIMIDNFQWTYEDSVAPTVTTLAPADDATGVVTTTNLVVTFSEPVLKGTGDITLKLSSSDSPVATIPVIDAAVVVTGETATITLPAPLAGSTGYYVNIASGAFKDAANNNFTGIGDNSTWNFTTGVVDGTPPTVATLVPADNALNVLPTSNLELTFDEDILAGSGSVVIKKVSDDSVVETLTVPSPQVTVSGATATLNPVTTLDYSTSYYVEVSVGAFKDLANNNFAGISGNSTWNFTTRAAPVLLISQYYEGTGSNRYIELKNLSGSQLSLDGYRVVAWSDTPPSDNEGWKSGTNTSDRVTDLAGKMIPANGTFLIAESGVTAPAYAANNHDLAGSGGGTAYNGDDSVVLYQGTGFSQEEVVDAVSFVANDGADKSFYRLNDGVGFDFASGSSILNYTGVWGTKTLTEVADATPANEWYLKASEPLGTLTLSIDPLTFSEGAGTAAATATITRSGRDNSQPLFVTIQTVGTKATAPEFVEIPANTSSAQFPIDAIDDPWLLGDATVTFTVKVLGYLPTNEQVTVFDQESDAPFPVVINEVDADQTGTDSAEFIELYNNSSSPVSLDGLVLVLYNGSGDLSYNTIDLTGYSIPANDFFVIGSATVPNVDLTAFTIDGIQNGEDAVALYAGAAAAFPNSTPVTTTSGILIDALVYDTNDEDDAILLAALLPAGKPQVNESANNNSANESMSRVPDGGAVFDTSLYAVQIPTPGATNVIAPPGNTFSNWMASYDFSGFTSPDLSTTGDPDNDGLDNALENILGSNPSVANQWLSALSYSGNILSFQHRLNPTPATDLSFVYEWSTDLVNWYGSTVANPGGTMVTIISVNPLDPPDQDLFFVTATVTGTPANKVFVRLKVEQN